MTQDNETIAITVAEEFVAERVRQIIDLGYTPEHDDEHRLEELLTFTKQRVNNVLWAGFDQSVVTRPEERRQELVKAGALLIAAIAKMDREKS